MCLRSYFNKEASSLGKFIEIFLSERARHFTTTQNRRAFLPGMTEVTTRLENGTTAALAAQAIRRNNIYYTVVNSKPARGGRPDD